MKFGIVILLLLLCAGSFAQPQPTAIFRIDQGVTPPVLLSKREPAYSEEARLAKLQGGVGLAVVIGEDGKPRDIRVTDSLGLGLDELAVAAVKEWQFRPGTKDGHTVAVQANVEVKFRIFDDPRKWSLSGVDFTIPHSATRPKILKAPQDPGDNAERGSVRVAFDVTAEGVPANIGIENSSDPKWNEEAMALIREWRFDPASDSGKAIGAHAVFDLEHGVGVSLNEAPVLAKQ